jgi:hypothetical protein
MGKLTSSTELLPLSSSSSSSSSCPTVIHVIMYISGFQPGVSVSPGVHEKILGGSPMYLEGCVQLKKKIAFREKH